MTTIKPFAGKLNLNAPPFAAPPGATENGVPVGPTNYDLYCSEALAVGVKCQIEQAAALQGFSATVTITDGILSGSYGDFTDGTDLSKILILETTITDPNGNSWTGSDIAGKLVQRYFEPFTPGAPNQGDKDYKVVDPVVNGQLDAADATDVPVAGYGVLVSDAPGTNAQQSGGLPIAVGGVIQGNVRLVWYAVPVAPAAPVAPQPGTPFVL